MPGSAVHPGHLVVGERGQTSQVGGQVAGSQLDPIPPGLGRPGFRVVGGPLGPAQLLDQATDPVGRQGEHLGQIGVR